MLETLNSIECRTVNSHIESMMMKLTSVQLQSDVKNYLEIPQNGFIFI